MLFVYGHLTSSTILLRLNLYNDASQNDFLGCPIPVTEYSDRLAVLGLRSLQLRRLHQDVIYTLKIIFVLVDLDCLKFFLISPNETTRGHVSKLFVRHSRVDVRKHFWKTRC